MRRGCIRAPSRRRCTTRMRSCGSAGSTSPPGVRMAGELDYTRAGALSDALAEAVRLDHDVHLNLSQLRFIDARAAAVVLQAAASLPASRRMVAVCATSVDRTLT